MALSLRYAAISDRGVVRKGNQDSVYAGPHFIAVADGMGGMAAGDLASAIVINTMRTIDRPPPDEAVDDELADTVASANQHIRHTVEHDPGKEGMGTTLTGMWFDGSWFHLVHIGDSRAYRLRSDTFEQLTMDDSYVQLLINEGQITPEEAETHPQRSLILRALGAPEVEPAFQTLAAHAGDRILLCSDGLSGPVSDNRIHEVMRDADSPDEVVQTLTQAALDAGAPDNVTVLVADVVESDDASERTIIDGAAHDLVLANSDTTSLPRIGSDSEDSDADDDSDDPDSDDADRAPSKGRGRVWRTVLVGVFVLALIAGAGLIWVRSQYYLGVSDDDSVSLYRGLPHEAFGVSLSWVEVETDRSIDDANEGIQEDLNDGLPVDSYEHGIDRLDEITDSSADNTYLLPLCAESTDDDVTEAQQVNSDGCRTE
ncbi:PP2C family protein-serine/threonine phosphatase [Haloglycomyces albus]|uniref:PP2C family protein-serine/threonine phosphatase n=1 Tax=Haloglycomyces albus TaxID=526067 RepID=UPI0004B56E02|nr:protein phosphatase 2C domain-containing protein [Haloglycomyces albus]